MADFFVAIRSSYRDVARLALDLRPGDFEVGDGRIVKWRNSAPPPWSSGGARFGDAAFGTHSRRPWRVGDAARFFASAQNALLVPLSVAYAASQDWTFAWDLVPGDRTAKQAVFFRNATAAGGVAAWRIGSDGDNYGYQIAGTEVLTALGEASSGSYMLGLDGGGNTADLLALGAEVISSGASANVSFPISDSALLIGHSDSGDFLDGDLRAIRIWNRVLSPKERDFAFQSLGAADHSSGVAPDSRASVEVRAWVDGTGDLSLRQTRRVNPLGGRHQKFYCAVTDYSAGIVQIACETSGDVLPDADLGGDLYTMTSIERASVAEPTVTQDAGWSSIFDVRIAASGHYTFLLERPNHGGVYVHLDAEIG